MTVTVRAFYDNLNIITPQVENVNLVGRIDLQRIATAPNDLTSALPVAFRLTPNILNAANAGDFTFQVVANPANIILTGAQVLAGGLTFPANISDLTVFVFTAEDALFEGGALGTPEVLVLDLLPVLGSYEIDSNIVNTFSAGLIVDNEIAPTITISAPAFSNRVAEGAGNANYTITQSAVSGLNTNFTFATSAGISAFPATAGADFTTVNSTFTIPAGQTSVVVSVPITQDTIDERGTGADFEQDFRVTISAPVNATLTGTTTGVTSITDDDAAPIIGIIGNTATEGNPVNLTVGFTGATTATEFGAVNGNVSTTGVTASALNDFTALVAQAFSIPALATSLTVPVTTINDAIAEPAETFTATLAGITALGGGTVTNGTLIGTGTITDNDPVNVTINAGTPNPVLEGTAPAANPTVSFTATLGTAISAAVTYDVVVAGTGLNPATPGTDTLASVPLQVTFPANSIVGATQNFVVPVVSDALSEANEQFTVQLVPAPVVNTLQVNSSLLSTVTITDDDTTVSVAPVNNPLVEGSLIPGIFRFTRVDTAAATTSLTANFNILNSPTTSLVDGIGADDYVQTGAATFGDLAGTVVFPIGVTTVDVNLFAIADGLVEVGESVQVTLTPVVNLYGVSGLPATITINDQLPGTTTVNGRPTINGGLFTGTNSIDVIAGDRFNAKNDTIAGFAGNDIIFGLTGNDSIDGGFGNDTVYGGTQNDTLLGNIGDDLLFGEGGVDRLIGGTGADRFIFTAFTDSTVAAPDTIVDFTQGATEDRIVLTGLGFTGIAPVAAGSLLGFSTVGGVTTIVNAAGTFAINLTGTIALTAADFIF